MRDDEVRRATQADEPPPDQARGGGDSPTDPDARPAKTWHPDMPTWMIEREAQRARGDAVDDSGDSNLEHILLTLLAIQKRISNISQMEARKSEHWVLAMLEELSSIRDQTGETIRIVAMDNIADGTIRPAHAAKSSKVAITTIYRWMEAAGISPKRRGFVKGRPRRNRQEDE